MNIKKIYYNPKLKIQWNNITHFIDEIKSIYLEDIELTNKVLHK